MNIYLIRHGRQNSKLCNVNVSLSQIGMRQASLVAKRLISYDIDCIYSSHLLRARETADIINKELNVPQFMDERLREIEYGDWQGKSDEYINEYYKDFKTERDKLIHDTPFPNGECGQDVMERMSDFIKEILSLGYENVALVTHGGVIRSFVAGILGLSQAKRYLLSLDLDNTSITHLLYKEKTSRFYLERLNDSAHLEKNPKMQRKNWK